MGKTLEELKKENERLKSQIESKEDFIEIGRRRNRLLKQNRALLRKLKHPIVHKTSQMLGSASVRAGKKIGEGLIKIAIRINEAEKRQEMLRRKAMKTPRKKPTTQRKPTPKKRKTSRKKR